MYPKRLIAGEYVTLYGICIAIGVLLCIYCLRYFGKKTNVDRKFLDFVELCNLWQQRMLVCKSISTHNGIRRVLWTNRTPKDAIVARQVSLCYRSEGENGASLLHKGHHH